MIKNFEPRLYQQTILATAALKNTLVVLPTGLGKTHIFVMLAAQRLRQYPESKIVLLGPTRPLIDQYKRVFEENFEIANEKMIAITGSVSPEKRAELWEKSQIIFSTPQGLENDILNGRISLKEVSLLGFDEAHRAVGDYSYVWIAQKYEEKSKFPRIIGMTASPGSDQETIKEVCQNLKIEEIEVRSESDNDVKPYIQKLHVEWIMVNFGEELKQIHSYLKECYISKLKTIKEKGYLKSTEGISKRELLGVQASLHAELSMSKVDFDVMRAISICAEALKVQHAVELIETQGVEPLHKYLLDINQQSLTTKTKAVINLVKDVNFRSALLATEVAISKNIEHPKLTKLKEIITEMSKIEKENLKIIIFNQYRDSASTILSNIKTIEGIKPALFVGQQKKGLTGMSQKEQLQTIQDFKEGKYNVLIMTSVGEEGLDIPSVDHVIFFEPIPSAIRQIQRRGRTGRHDTGNVLILVTKDTRDEVYRWSAHHKEKRMYSVLKDIRKKGMIFLNHEEKNEQHLDKKSMIEKQKEQKTLEYTFAQKSLTEEKKESKKIEQIMPKENETSEDKSLVDAIAKKESILSLDDMQRNNKIVIYIDHREKANDVPKKLFDLGITVKLEQLESADYIISSRCGIEFKQLPDFVQSLIDGRLLEQVSNLQKNFEKPLIIVQGTEDMYGLRNIHPNALRGLLATIAIDFRIPILYTKDSSDTAATIIACAKREQETRDVWISGSQKKPTTEKEVKESIIASLPQIGPNIARELLQTFGSVNKIINATEEELRKVEKIGKIRAKDIRKIIDEPYILIDKKD